MNKRKQSWSKHKAAARTRSFIYFSQFWGKGWQLLQGPSQTPYFCLTQFTAWKIGFVHVCQCGKYEADSSFTYSKHGKYHIILLMRWICIFAALANTRKSNFSCSDRAVWLTSSRDEPHKLLWSIFQYKAILNVNHKTKPQRTCNLNLVKLNIFKDHHNFKSSIPSFACDSLFSYVDTVECDCFSFRLIVFDKLPYNRPFHTGIESRLK